MFALQMRVEADLDDVVLALRTEAMNRGVDMDALDVRLLAQDDQHTADMMDALAQMEEILDDALSDPASDQGEEPAAVEPLPGQAPVSAMDFMRAPAITPLERKQKTPLYEGAAITLVMYCLLRYNWALAHKVGELALRELLIQDAYFYPKPNIVPRTVYSVRRVLGLKEPKEYLRHHCLCGQVFFTHVSVQAHPCCCILILLDVSYFRIPSKQQECRRQLHKC